MVDILKLVSVIISTYNRPDALDAVLQGLAVQIRCNFEVVIADDGSKPCTTELIMKFKQENKFTITHTWQEDHGFRAAQARNRAVAVSSGDYLVFLDGDCIPRRDFISRHQLLAETGWFVRGNRIMLSEAFTQRVLSERISVQDWSMKKLLQNRINGNMRRVLPAIRLADSPLRKLKKTQWYGVKTCNLGVWRSDFLAVNGFDESFQGWGHEDADLAVRLIRSGVLRKEGIYSTAVFHLWHEMADRSKLEQNVSRLEQSITSDSVRAETGVSQYLST